MRSATATFRLWLVVALAALASAVLGAVGFVAYLPTQPGFAEARATDIAYYTAQLFVLDPTPFSEPRPYPLPIPLEIARFLAPATTILVVVEMVRVLVWGRVRRWAAAHGRGHVIVTGNEPVALMLARRFAADGERVVLVSDNVGDDVARRHGLYVVPGDPAEEATLRAAGVPRAASVYACGGDSATNLAVALTTRRLAATTRRMIGLPSRLAAMTRRRAARPVTVQVEIRDAQLFADLKVARRTHGDPSLRLRYFVIEELAAHALLAQEALLPGRDDAEPVVVLGAGPFGRAVVRQLGSRRNPPPVTQVADVDAAAWVPPADSTGIRLYVCLADPDLALHTALTATRTGLGRVVLCLQQQAAFEDALGLFDDTDGRLAVFGILDAACAAAPRDPIDELGRAIHDRYVQSALAKGDKPATNASLVPWAKLPAHLKRSNWAHADHIGTKLATIGSVIVPASEGAESFSFRPGEVERLARLEHKRWMAERHDAGFVYGPQRNGHFHPDLVDWEHLPPEARAKDIDLIEHLPELLYEANYQILRL
ncbi:MAG: NAD-binding protein [Pseudonocardiales bacterium]